MEKTQAEWREHLNDEERSQLKIAKGKRDSGIAQFSALTRTLKNRCMARMAREVRRAKD
jgi:hypothetical protein